MEKPKYTIELPDEMNTGDKFNFGIEQHEVIGFVTENQFVHVMYSQLLNETDGLRHVNKWEQVGNSNQWTLEFASRYTVLDLVARFDKQIGF